MPTSLKELDQTYRRTYRRLITGVIIIYGAGLLLGVLLTLGHPKVATWISQAAEAEGMPTVVTAGATTTAVAVNAVTAAVTMNLRSGRRITR